ncbi:hypothetical protein Pmani_014526 [Petrolisthes manimaculis]|uniref:Uncharacterized protein n=1 Tax=Petrolisthes manimaculis TaxID=1843537 RepID=A0AAE1U8B3_9EUCA|nr:hypothetical protein Pmani_014526 [Petrolisthes manimaculis]
MTPYDNFFPCKDTMVTLTIGIRVLTTRSFHSADYDTNHSLVSSKVCMQPKCIHRSKQKGRPCINTARIAMSDLCERFACSIEEALTDFPTSGAEERWHYIRDVIHTSAMDTFGKRERQNPDWFEAGIAELEPALSAKRTALLDYKREPSEKTLDAFRNAQNDAQGIARCCPKDRSTQHQRLLPEPLSEHSTLL